MRAPAVTVALFALASSAGAGNRALDFEPSSLLPPVSDWHGASEALIASPGDPWITPAEKSGFRKTPGYTETQDWLTALAGASDRLHLVPIGKSWEGRTVWMAVASAEGASTAPELLATGKPVLLAQGAIHAGEVDGKDAGLMLLRDLTMGPLQELLDHVSLLFVPILNVDGHERVSTLSRVNQRGPSEMGWRTNARNLNLNRDYAKLDTPEVRAIVGVLSEWQPDLYLDLHVTDGSDKQNDVTWGFNRSHGHSPAVGRWLEERLDPALTEGLVQAGHLPGPHVFVLDQTDPAKGIWLWEGGPRYSDGYGSSRHLATVLVETHSLKPFRQRVLGTRVLLELTLGLLADQGETLAQATSADRDRRWAELTLGWERDLQPDAVPITFQAIEQRLTPSTISGARRIEWTGVPTTIEVPLYRTRRPLGAVPAPAAYWVPAAWTDVIERLTAHGIEMEVLSRPKEMQLEFYRFAPPEYAETPFEGRFRVEAKVTPQRMTRRFATGSVRVPTDQALGVLAMLLLEPGSPDSFFQWGFFSEIFQRTEYAESYVLEPLAERMLLADPDLRREFEQRLASDEEFASSPRQRLQWFYERSPLRDPYWRVYPVGREPGTDTSGQ